MILTRALEHGWRQRADLHASLMVPSDLLLALLDAVQASRDMEMSLTVLAQRQRDQCCGGEECRVHDTADARLAAWRKVVGE